MNLVVGGMMSCKTLANLLLEAKGETHTGNLFMALTNLLDARVVSGVG